MVDSGHPEDMCYLGACADPGVVAVNRNRTVEAESISTLQRYFYEQTFESDLRFSNRYIWYSGLATPPADAFDAYAVATHESGHAVGLVDMYGIDYEWLSMYGSGSAGRMRARDLARGDVLGMRKKYPGRRGEIPDCTTTC